MNIDSTASLESKERPDAFSGPTSATSKESEVDIKDQGTILWNIYEDLV